MRNKPLRSAPPSSIRRFAALFASLSTPAKWLHPAEHLDAIQPRARSELQLRIEENVIAFYTSQLVAMQLVKLLSEIYVGNNPKRFGRTLCPEIFGAYASFWQAHAANRPAPGLPRCFTASARLLCASCLPRGRAAVRSGLAPPANAAPVSSSHSIDALPPFVR
jgi:hypothetical protein